MSWQESPNREQFIKDITARGHIKPNPEWERLRKVRRDKQEPYEAKDFPPGAALVGEYRAKSGRTVRLLLMVVDSYDHPVLCEWGSKACVYAQVIAVQESDQEPLIAHTVKVSVGRDNLGWFSRMVRFRPDLDFRQESWL